MSDLAVISKLIVQSINTGVSYLGNVLPHYNTVRKHYLVARILPICRINLEHASEFQELITQLHFVTSPDTIYQLSTEKDRHIYVVSQNICSFRLIVNLTGLGHHLNVGAPFVCLTGEICF